MMRLRGKAAVAGAMVVLAAAGRGHAATGAVRAHVAAVRIAGGTRSCAQLEALWESAGGAPGAAFTAAQIAMAESGGSQYATDADSDGTVDRGYWQINSVHGPLSTYDPYGNARAAVLISGDGTDWTPWVTFNSGAYAGQC